MRLATAAILVLAATWQADAQPRCEGPWLTGGELLDLPGAGRQAEFDRVLPCAVAGVSDAQTELSIMYGAGYGVAKDDAEASRLWALAERDEPSEYRTRLAFEAAVAIDTLEAFDAFLRIFPPGAYADRIIAVRDAYLGIARWRPDHQFSRSTEVVGRKDKAPPPFDDGALLEPRRLSTAQNVSEMQENACQFRRRRGNDQNRARLLRPREVEPFGYGRNPAAANAAPDGAHDTSIDNDRPPEGAGDARPDDLDANSGATRSKRDRFSLGR